MERMVRRLLNEKERAMKKKPAQCRWCGQLFQKQGWAITHQGQCRAHDVSAEMLAAWQAKACEGLLPAAVVYYQTDGRPIYGWPESSGLTPNV